MDLSELKSEILLKMKQNEQTKIKFTKCTLTR